MGDIIAVLSAVAGVYVTAVAYGWLPSPQMDGDEGNVRRFWRPMKLFGPLMFVHGLFRIIF